MEAYIEKQLDETHQKNIIIQKRQLRNLNPLLRGSGIGALLKSKKDKDCIIKKYPRKNELETMEGQFKLAQMKRYNKIYLQQEVEKIHKFTKFAVAQLKDTEKAAKGIGSDDHDFYKVRDYTTKILNEFRFMYRDIMKLQLDIGSISKALRYRLKSTAPALVYEIFSKIFFRNGRILELNSETEPKIKMKLEKILEREKMKNEISALFDEMMKAIEELKKLILGSKKLHYEEAVQKSEQIFQKSIYKENNLKWKKTRGKNKMKSENFGKTDIENLVSSFHKKKNVQSDMEFLENAQDLIKSQGSFLALNGFLREKMRKLKDFEAKQAFICVHKG